MLLDSRKNNYFKNVSNLPFSLGQNQKLSLEGNFDDYYTLYVPDSIERDALYILTPDVMQELIANNQIFDIEVKGNYVYLYKNGNIGLTSEKELKKLFALINSIKKEMFKQIRAYKGHERNT